MKKLKRYFLTIGVAALSAQIFSALAGLVPFVPDCLTAFFILQYGAVTGLLTFCYSVAYIKAPEQRMTQLLLFYLITLSQLVRHFPSALSRPLCCVLYSLGGAFGVSVSALCIVAGDADKHLEV